MTGASNPIAPKPVTPPAAPARPAVVSVPEQNVAAPAAPPQPASFPSTVGVATPKWRHNLLALSFVLMVLLPPFGIAFYLWSFAADQYHSRVGFAVRLEEQGSALSLLSGLGGFSGSSSTDTDILFEFIQSPRLVETVNKQLDLESVWTKPAFDPVFALGSEASIEDLVKYWNKMVYISRGKGAGILEVEVRAFDPTDAQKIAELLFEESSRMVNDLSAIAREDAIRYARDDLTEAEERLKTAREVVTTFRNLNQIVSPELEVQRQAGLLATLYGQQANMLIEIDLLRETAREGDPRLVQAERRLRVIEARISDEKDKLGQVGEDGTAAYADLVGDYERIVVEREFAQEAYMRALAVYESALAEARRKSRYLAAYMQPTLAETALYPRRPTILMMGTLFMFLAWAIGALIYYSIRDRR